MLFKLACRALLSAVLLSSAVRAEAPRDTGDWRQHCGSPDHNNERALKNQVLCPEVLWRHADATGAPAVYKDRVYVGGSRLWVLDLKTGKDLTPVQTGGGGAENEGSEEGGYASTPAVLDDRVVAAHSSGAVHAFDLDLGKKLWEIEAGGEARGWGLFAPAFDEGMLVVAGGPVLGIDPAAGRIVWRAEGIEGPVEMAPAIWKKRVFFGTREGRLYALELATGRLVWKTEHECQFGHSDPALASGRLFLSDRGGPGRRGAFHAFDPENGKEIWKTDFGMTGSSAPGFSGRNVFWGFGKLVALYDQATGKVDEANFFRTDTNPFGSPTAVGDSMIFGNLDGYLYVFDLKRARLKWRFSPRSGEDDTERTPVMGFVYHPSGVILARTTKGLFALGQSRKTRVAEAGYTLFYKPEPKLAKGKVVEIRELESGGTVYVIETEEGEKVEASTDKENLAKWLLQSWEGKCKVKVAYREGTVGGKRANVIESVSPYK